MRISKYLDHLPLYRQERMLERWGAAIPRASLCEWIRIAAEWLQPIYRLMHAHLLSGDYLQADDGARSAEKAKPGARRRVRRAGARAAGGETNKLR